MNCLLAGFQNAIRCRQRRSDRTVSISIRIRSSSLNNEGHNYFLSQNPYTLNSYAGFGEAYYNIVDDLKLTGGLRWTEDQKHFIDIPSELLYEAMAIPSQAS